MVNKNNLKYVGDISPVVTEKALKVSGDSYVVFSAPASATKDAVKKAVEFLYSGSKITKINVAKVKGKVKRFRGKIGKRADQKKFFIKFDKPIDITTGVK